MNILYLGLTPIYDLRRRGIYTDLLKSLALKGHRIYCVTSLERRRKEKTKLYTCEDGLFLLVKTLNMQKTNNVEKGLATLLINSQYKKAIRKFFKGVKFDLILYSTPPITLFGVVKSLKKRDGAQTYLLLKDIFPQNAIDMGFLSKNGIKGFIYRYFRRKERQFYSISDRIGCMSKANVRYILENNPEIDNSKVGLFPNSVGIQDFSDSFTQEKKAEIRARYKIPQNKKVFVYGGNLGKPQGIPFVIECLQRVSKLDDAFFVILGSGTSFPLLKEYCETSRQSNFLLYEKIPVDDFNELLAACDVGLVFLDHSFTIPNFPSRLLSYMQAHLPILACTDRVSDVKDAIKDGGFGWWCESNDSDGFFELVKHICLEDLIPFGERSFRYLREHFDVNAWVDKTFPD